MKKQIAFIVLGVSLIASIGFAGIQGGEREIGGQFSIISPSEGDPSWLAVGSFGYFLNANVSLKAAAFVIGAEDSTMGFVTGTLDYYFNNGNDVIPFVGAGLGTAVGDDVESDMLLNVHGGFKQFVSESTSINYSIEYVTMTDDTSSGTTSGTVGFSIYF